MKILHRKKESPQDVGLDIFLDDFTDTTCGLEHPKREGNECLQPYGHIEDHADADGNTWKGRP